MAKFPPVCAYWHPKLPLDFYASAGVRWGVMVNLALPGVFLEAESKLTGQSQAQKQEANLFPGTSQVHHSEFLASRYQIWGAIPRYAKHSHTKY